MTAAGLIPHLGGGLACERLDSADRPRWRRRSLGARLLSHMRESRYNRVVDRLVSRPKVWRVQLIGDGLDGCCCLPGERSGKRRSMTTGAIPCDDL